MAFEHTSVLRSEAIVYLAPRPGGVYVDATLGGGGHAVEVARRIAPGGRLVAIDRDRQAVVAGSAALRQGAPGSVRIDVVESNFDRLEAILDDLAIDAVDGVLFDLGVSSPQLDVADRGFTFREDAPLDMRMDASQALTAAELVNTAPEAELRRIIEEYGEERWAGRIARFIVERRTRSPIATTADLVDVIKAAVPAAARRRGPHPARRTFQALRIAVNDELGSLRRALEAAIRRLAPGGRLVVISFHSLEDRIVKEVLREGARGCVCPPDFPECRCGRQPVLAVLTRKPVVPGPDEVRVNRRARSARLRAAERLAAL